MGLVRRIALPWTRLVLHDIYFGNGTYVEQDSETISVRPQNFVLVNLGATNQRELDNGKRTTAALIRRAWQAFTGTPTSDRKGCNQRTGQPSGWWRCGQALWRF
jgi:hypothetical protein